MPRYANTAFNSVAPGLSRLAQALAGGQGAYDAGANAETGRQSKMAQALAAMRASEAAARSHNATADQTAAETGVITSRPELIDESIAAQTGSTLPMLQAVRDFIKTGQRPMRELPGPVTEDGIGAGSAPVVDDAIQSRIAQALARSLPMRTNLKDTKPDDLAKAQEIYRDSDIQDRVYRGEIKPQDYGAVQYAAKGQPLFHSAEYGVTNNFTGSVDASGAPAQRFGKYRDASTGAQKANAVQSLASAGASNASATKTRAETDELRAGSGRGGKAPTGYRWNADGSLESIPGGPADPLTKGAKLAKPPTEGQAKALMFGSRMAVADEILGDLAKAGSTQPNLVKKSLSGVPIVGKALAGVAGVGSTDNARQVEQAQRDFINAVLRRESGAAIAESEFENARQQYFDSPLDDAQTRRNKAANRKTAIAGFEAEFGEQSMPQYKSIIERAREARKAPAAKSGTPGPAGGGLSPEEAAELAALKKRLGR